jgi:hypothetical protein
MRLFDRVVELRVGDTEITGLDITFEIEKDLTPEPNPCHIEIYNLSSKNREILSKYKRVPILLRAGYQGHVSVIYDGDLMRCTHIKEGPSWKTLLTNGEGANAIQSTRINKSFAKGTPVKTVIKEIAKQLKIPSNDALRQLESIADKLNRGFSVSGSPMDELCCLLRQYDYSASVQNNSLQVLKNGQSLEKETINLTPHSGLKSSPEMGTDKKIQAHSVLMPELLPGRKIHIESAAFKGFATIQSIRFEGANFGDAWGAELVCLIAA